MPRLQTCFALILLLVSTSLFAATSPQPISHVIYITLDGVRWQDVFEDRIYFQNLWNKHANNGIFYGAPDSDTYMEVASIPVSLPSYQSQMAGAIQLCGTNLCGRITVETLPEKLIHALQLTPREVATIASWPTIDFATQHIAGTSYSNSGNIAVTDPITQTEDDEMREINKKQIYDHPRNEDRYDRYTFAHALHYFEKYKPAYLWISLAQADEAAHAANLEEYHASLKEYDVEIDRLISRLKALNVYDKTLIIITTDHGRGNGKHWTDHGPFYPESKRTWAFVLNGELTQIGEKLGKRYYSTLSIRPTIEKALGVS